jgi:hypothetical protein
MNRDEFPARTKETIAKRVGFHCSNPKCNVITTGPHSDIRKATNLGVACHITAASPGGPRYDPNLTKAQRSDFKNAIWLCQKCSRQIDVDEVKYPEQLLQDWKLQAENKAEQALGFLLPQRFYPQPASLIMTPIPIIRHLRYRIARQLLIDSGWHPKLNAWNFQSENITLKLGSGEIFWKEGFHEIENACPTGLAPCVFKFSDMQKNTLIVITLGEEYPEHDAFACVESWFLE